MGVVQSVAGPVWLAKSTPTVPRPRSTGDYIWLCRGCQNPSLGFPASTSEVRRLVHLAHTIHISLPPPPLSISHAAMVMGDRRAEKRSMEAPDLEGEKRRERQLRDKAKREM